MGGARLGDETSGSEQKGVMQSSFFSENSGNFDNFGWAGKFFGQDLRDEHFISTNINMPLFKIAIDRLADRRVNELND